MTMKTTIVSEKEKILEGFKKFDGGDGFSSWDEENDFLSQSLDHIASVSRQEGREEILVDLFQQIEGMSLTTDETLLVRADLSEWINDKLTGKEKGKA